jgi:hypothetical protein
MVVPDRYPGSLHDTPVQALEQAVKMPDIAPPDKGIEGETVDQPGMIVAEGDKVQQENSPALQDQYWETGGGSP